MMNNTADNIVEVKDAYKRYGRSTVILNGLNMTVKRGTVYAFLGPSGCGKTTLLKCIVGRHQLDAGEIRVGLKSKADIGYMPQETALLDELSIRETITYYGWMYSITEMDLTKRKEQLLDFLDLPPETRTINTLSGGQKRRVSLCIALLHNPKLLILDEPTVGVDPLLSQSIWNYLTEISTVENKTVIITTHYIEEARQGNKVGMMRGGVLLVEGEAPAIMAQYGCDTLEEVFLQLSYKQETTVSKENKEVIGSYPKPTTKPKLPLAQDKWLSLNHLLSNIIKNAYFLKRSSLAWLLLLMNPIFQCILYEYVISDPKGLKIGVVNNEFMYSQEDCNSILNHSCFKTSCKYLDAVKKKNIELISYKDMHNALIDVQKNRIWGYLYISSNFTESLHYRVMNVNNITEEILEDSAIAVSMDMSNQYISNFLRRNLYSSFFDYLEMVQNDCNWFIRHIKLPIKFNEPVYGETNPKFSDFSIIGLLLLLEFFLPVSYSLATLKDKMEGVEERNIVAGMSNLEILLGHAVLTIVIFSIQTVFMMCILYGIYDHTIHGSHLLAVSLIFLIGVSGMCYGYFMAVTCDRDSTALYMALGSFVALANISGMFWPTEGMHYLLRSASWLLPLLPATEALRGIAARSWTITHPVIYNGFLSVMGYIFLLCISIAVVIKLKKKL